MTTVNKTDPYLIPGLEATSNNNRVHGVNGVLFDKLKARAGQTTARQVDPLIYPLLMVVNQAPYLATVWSCSGHDAHKPGTRDDFGYLVFVGDVRQMSRVERFATALQRKGIALEFDSLQMPPVPGYDEDTWYSTITHRWHFPTELGRQRYIEGLEKVIQEVINNTK